MRRLSAAGSRAIDDIALRHGFSVGATLHMLDAVIRGNGSMAQFDHREFLGAGQWVRGGMTMVTSLFDNDLKSWVDALCLDLANMVVREPGLFNDRGSVGAGPGRIEPDLPVGRRTVARSGDWWPAGMGHPNSAGSQDGVRYAYFARAKRLAIERDGVVSLYDTADHQIRGVASQQVAGAAIAFTSPDGPVRLTSLREISTVR